MPTQKQIDILVKNGYSEAQIQNMSYEELSAKIGEILSKPKNNTTSDRSWPQKASKSQKTYHLTPEQIRTNALDLTIKYFSLSAAKNDHFYDDFWSMVQDFRNYIENDVSR